MNSPPNANQPDTTSELRSDAKELGKSAKDRIHGELDSRKGAAASQAKSVSSALQRTAGELGNDSPEWLRSILNQGASQIQRFADTLEQKDSRAIMNDVRNFARDNPTTFLAGCAAAGFAAARIFKAGGDEHSAEFRSDTQGPPPQVEEPTFRGSAGTARQGATGEFV